MILSSDDNNTADNGHFDSERERFLIVDAMFLFITLGNKTSFVPFRGSIRFQLDFINPFAPNGFLVSRKRNQIPCIILFKSKEFNLHGLNPIRIICSYLIKYEVLAKFEE